MSSHWTIFQKSNKASGNFWKDWKTTDKLNLHFRKGLSVHVTVDFSDMKL